MPYGTLAEGKLKRVLKFNVKVTKDSQYELLYGEALNLLKGRGYADCERWTEEEVTNKLYTDIPLDEYERDDLYHSLYGENYFITNVEVVE